MSSHPLLCGERIMICISGSVACQTGLEWCPLTALFVGYFEGKHDLQFSLFCQTSRRGHLLLALAETHSNCQEPIRIIQIARN